jgi:hypothetical protein
MKFRIPGADLTPHAAEGTHDREGIAARIDDYAALSRGRAASGDAHGAVLAAWAADVHLLQSLLWEHGPADASAQTAQLAAVEESVRRYAANPGSLSGTRAIAVAARAALTEALDNPVRDLLVDRFLPLDHLDGLDHPKVGDTATVIRLDRRTADELFLDLRVTATDCMAVAREMVRAGRLTDAAHQVWMADLAAFEAYLLTAASAVADRELTTVDLRWELARTLLGELPARRGKTAIEGTADLEQAVEDIRERLVRSVGPAEVAALRAAFEPFRPQQ